MFLEGKMDFIIILLLSTMATTITSEKTIIKYSLTFLKMYKLAGWAITELPVKILAHREGVQ
jgi:ABC-type uncharacterized transport system permease subunit